MRGRSVGTAFSLGSASGGVNGEAGGAALDSCPCRAAQQSRMPRMARDPSDPFGQRFTHTFAYGIRSCAERPIHLLTRKHCAVQENHTKIILDNITLHVTFSV